MKKKFSIKKTIFDKKNVEFLKKRKFKICLTYVTSMLPIKSIRSSRLAGQREHLYECIVLLFRRLAEGPGVARGKKNCAKKFQFLFACVNPPAYP